MNARLTSEERQWLHSLIREKLELGREEWIEDTTDVRELPGIDSMKILRLVAGIELGFHVDLGFEAIPEVQTVQDIERLICQARERYAVNAPSD
ncbi:Acyl carrier protein [Lentzea fradiae]|uniref:Acyl carrier protein n=1 Tax=Lentzea fradiae TaxID=200378 RepID=A0A1G7QH39_9PSEU|nr:acyl carrier protein [Lentzea fradiae]SDF97279.1 Acyl carrier protein [Lentzea fradiae]